MNTAPERMHALVPILEFRRLRRRNGKRGMSLPDGTAAHTEDQVVRFVASQTGVSPASVWNWFARYRRGGYNSLANRPRSDKGISTYFSTHPAALAILRQAARRGLSASACHSLLCERVEAPPSLPTVFKIHRRLVADGKGRTRH